MYEEATRGFTEDQPAPPGPGQPGRRGEPYRVIVNIAGAAGNRPEGAGNRPGRRRRINGLAGHAARGYCPGVSSWGHVEVAHVSHVLPDGRTLLDDVSFRIGEGTTAALVGPNGAGKTTLLRLVAGDLQPQEGSVTSTGGLGDVHDDAVRCTATARLAWARDHAGPWLVTASGRGRVRTSW